MIEVKHINVSGEIRKRSREMPIEKNKRRFVKIGFKEIEVTKETGDKIVIWSFERN